MPDRFSFVWDYAGYTGRVEDVDPSLDEEIDLFGSKLPTRRIRLTIGLDLDVAPLVERGYPLTSASGVLFLGDRRLISGQWSDVSYGARGEPIALTISETPETNGSTFPPTFLVIPRAPTLTVTTTVETLSRFDPAFPKAQRATVEQELTEYFDILPFEQIPDLQPGAGVPTAPIGRTYPFVWGAPGTSDYTGSPALFYFDDPASNKHHIMISGRTVPASTVTIWGPYADGSGGSDLARVASQVLDVAHEVDNAGRQVAYVALEASPSAGEVEVSTDPNAEYFASWTGGNATSDSTTETLAYMLFIAGIRVDLDALRAMRSVIDRYRFDFFVDKVDDTWDIISKRILPWLPVAWVPGPRGYAPVMLPVQELETAFTVTDGDGWHRDSPVRYEGIEVENQIDLKYAWVASKKHYYKRIVLAGDRWQDAADSQAAYGARPSRVRELDSIEDDATAHRVGRDLLALRSKPWRQVSGTFDPEVYGEEGDRPLRLGQWVKLEVPDLGLSRPACVVRLQRDGAGARVRFLVRG
tara:strand:+ start:3019 stop:4599 length:1581 start_codon:yes stop_codon:yes gene_type:complete